MSMRERRKARRESRRAVLGRVAAAPSFKSVKKERSKGRKSSRRLLLAAMFLPLSTVASLVVLAPKVAHASTGLPVPEVDPGSMASALTLLVGGVLALTDKVRRSK